MWLEKKGLHLIIAPFGKNSHSTKAFALAYFEEILFSKTVSLKDQISWCVVKIHPFQKFSDVIALFAV